MEPCLECFLVHKLRLRKYHELILRTLESMSESPEGGAGAEAEENWAAMFSLEVRIAHATV